MVANIVIPPHVAERGGAQNLSQQLYSGERLWFCVKIFRRVGPFAVKLEVL